MKITTHERIFKALQKLGLSNLEIQVYLALLQSGSIPASSLARKLNLNRSTTRYTLENLRKKRLSIQIEKNKTFYFTAQSPEHIPVLLREQKANLSQQEYAISKIINDLKDLQNPNAKIPKVQFFEGINGLIDMYQDILKECKKTKSDIYGHSRILAEDMSPRLWDFLANKYTPERLEMGNKAYMIWNESLKDSESLKQDKDINRTSLFVPEKNFPLETGLQIYGGKVAFYSRQDMTGVIIENPYILKGQLSLFKLAWNQALTFPQNKTHQHMTL